MIYCSGCRRAARRSPSRLGCMFAAGSTSPPHPYSYAPTVVQSDLPSPPHSCGGGRAYPAFPARKVVAVGPTRPLPSMRARPSGPGLPSPRIQGPYITFFLGLSCSSCVSCAPCSPLSPRSPPLFPGNTYRPASAGQGRHCLPRARLLAAAGGEGRERGEPRDNAPLAYPLFPPTSVPLYIPCGFRGGPHPAALHRATPSGSSSSHTQRPTPPWTARPASPAAGCPSTSARGFSCGGTSCMHAPSGATNTH